MSMQSAKPLLILALMQGSACSSLLSRPLFSSPFTVSSILVVILRISIILAAMLTAIKLIDILLIDIVLITSYCTSSHHSSCHSESCANYFPTLVIILAASYSLSSSPPAPSLTSYLSLCILQLPGVSVTLRAAITTSQSSPSYSPCPTRYCPHRDLLALIVTTSYLLSSSPPASSSPSSS